MKSFFLFLAFTFLFFNVSHSQGDFRRGYIIQNNSDSIVGLVDYRSSRTNSKFCFFRATKKSKTVRYAPGDINAYGYWNDKRLESKSIPGEDNISKIRFAEVLIKGSLSLYKYNTVFVLQKDSLITLSKRGPP